MLHDNIMCFIKWYSQSWLLHSSKPNNKNGVLILLQSDVVYSWCITSISCFYASLLSYRQLLTIDYDSCRLGFFLLFSSEVCWNIQPGNYDIELINFVRNFDAGCGFILIFFLVIEVVWHKLIVDYVGCETEAAGAFISGTKACTWKGYGGLFSSRNCAWSFVLI